jgi:dipeptidyl aminopeptidase/acylaminoacyl peptidase
VATIAPYGAWRSPITPASLNIAAVGLSAPSIAGDSIYWLELRPQDGGRQVVVERGADGTVRDLFEGPYSARSKVHEYGGASYIVAGAVCWFENADDQRVYRVGPDGSPQPITPAPSRPAAVRFADFALAPDRDGLYAVRETHGEDAVINELVRLDPNGEAEPVVVASGHDFYAAPRCSPDGQRLAFVAWDLPDMQWDESACYVAAIESDHTLAEPVRVAGGDGVSVSQPRFGPDNTLYYLVDQSGYWLPYDERGTALGPDGADFSRPDWVLGQVSYVITPAGELFAVRFQPDGQRLGRLEGGRFTPLDLPYLAYGDIATDGERIVVIGASDTTPMEVAVLRLASGEVEVVRRSRTPIPGVTISRAVPISFEGGDGAQSHAFFYPPANDDFEAPIGSLPPLIVLSHGGPTSAVAAVYDVGKQFFTSRGFGVVDVNYGGSSGYGRAYRNRLWHQWGILDVADCVAAARHLVSEGLADPSRLVIRGGSAGGYTTLAALATTDIFAAGSSHYGVSDLAGLASDTHKFESRYLDRLIGAWPEAAAVYAARSPLAHADEIRCPVIFFQGLDDAIVPPSQAEQMVAALSARGVPVAYLAFEGESHGFRRAETIEAVAGAELAFFGAVLGFSADGATELVIEHSDRPNRVMDQGASRRLWRWCRT